MVKAHDVAAFIIEWFNATGENDLTNHKLQYLLYFCQGYYLANYHKPLFREDVEATPTGVVCPDVFMPYLLADPNTGRILDQPTGDAKAIRGKTCELLDEVMQVMGQFSAKRLREMVVTDPPWLNCKGSGVIPQSSMYAHFRTL